MLQSSSKGIKEKASNFFKFKWFKKKEKGKAKHKKSEIGFTAARPITTKSDVSVSFTESQQIFDMNREKSLSIPHFKRRSDRMFDLINSVMQTKPTLLEGIPEEVVEPTVFTSPTDWTLLETTGKKDEDTYSVKYSPIKSIPPQDIGQTLQQGFRKDFLALSEDRCFRTKKTKKEKEKAIITNYGNDTPLQFLIRLGFTVEESVTRSRNAAFAACLEAAITEASIWSHSITRVHADLLILLSYKANAKMMRYFLFLAEAIVNNRIKTATQLDGFIQMLCLVEKGDISVTDIFGEAKTDEKAAQQIMEKKKREKAYLALKKKVLSENKKFGLTQLPLRTEKLLKYITSEFVYKPTVEEHIKLFAHYIGHNIISSSSQVEAAIIYLSETEKGKVNYFEFEHFCGIRSEIIPPSCWPWPSIETATDTTGIDIEEADNTLEINNIICSVN